MVVWDFSHQQYDWMEISGEISSGRLVILNAYGPLRSKMAHFALSFFGVVAGQVPVLVVVFRK